VLPAGVNFVPGTLKWYTNNQNGAVQNGSNEDIFFNQGGINFGNYAFLSDADKAANLDNGLLTYQTTIKGDLTNCTLTNSVFATASGTSETSATSTVNTDSASCKPTTPPVVKPAVLQNTGAGDVAGIFTATTVGSSAAYHVLSKKRANRR
jgi:hypothetical protein